MRDNFSSFLKKILIFVLIISLFFQNFNLTEASTEKIKLPFDLPYEEIKNYYYPYLIPPPKFISTGPGGLRRKSALSPPKLVFVVTPSQPNIYWKERTYDFYDQGGWFSQNIDTSLYEIKRKPKTSPIEFTVYKFLKKGKYNIDLIKPFTLNSIFQKETFKVFPFQEYEILENVYQDYSLKINPQKDTILKYKVIYFPPDFDIKKAGNLNEIPKEIIKIYTQLPDDFPQKFKDIAQKIKKEAKNELSQQILLTYKFVQKSLNYDLKWGEGKEIPKDYDILLWVYEHKKGICIHFATLFITLLRAQGIPARLAVGFAGGKVHKNSTFIYSSYAHAWAEVYLPNFGWVPIDPTKGAQGENMSPKVFDFPPEWANGGNVRPDLKFTLDDKFEKESKNNNNGNKGNGGKGGGDFQGDISQLPNLGDWVSSKDIKEWQKEKEKYQKEKLKETKETKEIEETEQKEEKETQKEKPSIFGFFSKIKSFGFLLFILFALFSTLFAFFYLEKLKNPKISTLKKEIKKRLKEIKKFVDIEKVIEKIKEFGKAQKYNLAILYGYNQLENYIAYVLDILNDPSLTAREFENLVNQIKPLKALNKIVECFERAKYGKINSKKDYDEFLKSIFEIKKEVK